MEPFRFHVYACDQQKPEGVPGCAARGSAVMIDALRKEIAARGLVNHVQLTTCGSLGLCERGPNLVIYPDGIWYSGVKPEDVPEIVESHFQQGRPVERLVNRDASALENEIRTNRDKYFAGLRARDAAGVMPDDLMQTIRGFQDSRVVLSAIELDVFSAVGDRATAAQVAKTIGADERATEMLLNALTALCLLVKKDGVFSVTPASKRFLTAGGQNDARAAMMHYIGLWQRWSTLTGAVRSGTGAKADREADWTRWFIAAMHRNASERSRAVVEAVGTTGVARMLDVGGGSGAYSIAFAKASNALHAEVFDLDPVLPLARSYIAEAGVESRVTTRLGDLRRDAFGEDFDLVLLSAICHMLGPDENRDLLKRCFAALRSGGRVVVQDFILDSTKTAPKAAALFSLNMLVGTEAGASYSEDEYRAWMIEAGLRDVSRIRLVGPTGLMIGSRS
ncbi:MAG: methyltransferase [Acidobacteria bacterium]|nr:methyltransferase [Acidobacteriota bacterium]